MLRTICLRLMKTIYKKGLKSTGPDGLGQQFYKSLSVTICKSVNSSNLFFPSTNDIILENGKGKITPMFKNGNNSEIGRYRTTSLLNFLHI